ncbi:MAG: hypothetical protein KJ749_09215 [Planctomycetes bacterium]|nr:hypothetical protein [Planctomycetota bacterium]
MKSCELAQTWRWALAVLLLLILIALAADWALLLRLNEDVARLIDDRARKGALPCAALPTRFVLESPDCAQRLLDSMNVTNVRVLPRGSSPFTSSRP